MSSYRELLAASQRPDGALNDFLAIRDGRLLFDGLDLLAAVERYGTPLEISLCPRITARIEQMQAIFAGAGQRAAYPGQFVYAYATKSNFAEEVVRTAVLSGAHYETSSAFDVRIAQRLWQGGLLLPERFIFCNGSKEPAYLRAILELRTAGFANVVPILDDLDELEALMACPEPILFGVRERKDAGDLEAGATYGYDRFGLLPDEMLAVAERLRSTRHRLVLYHAMVGSQLEDAAFFLAEVRESLGGYARLAPHAPDLAYFNFGGGFPTSAYDLAFRFDYDAVVEQLLAGIGLACRELGIAAPHLVGEFGRYTTADHGAHIFRVTRAKRPQPGLDGAPPWYLVDGSLMVALPDILIVEGQEFIALALNHFERQAGPAVLGGRRTCDSDDFYPRGRQDQLQLPVLSSAELAAEPLYIAFFGTGAYQSMLSGEGGAHHCLAPEAPKLIVERRGGALYERLVPEQSWEDVLSELGYPAT
jgi:arginine decarboxylase